MNWHRTAAAVLTSDPPGYWITREDVMGDRTYYLWHTDGSDNKAIIGESVDYQTLMEKAEKHLDGWPA